MSTLVRLSLVATVLAGAACAGSSSSQSGKTTTTSADRYGADAIDGQNRAPAGAATAWNAEGGPASPGMPSSGRIVEVPDEPRAKPDAGSAF